MPYAMCHDLSLLSQYCYFCIQQTLALQETPTAYVFMGAEVLLMTRGRLNVNAREAMQWQKTESPAKVTTYADYPVIYLCRSSLCAIFKVVIIRMQLSCTYKMLMRPLLFAFIFLSSCRLPAKKKST